VLCEAVGGKNSVSEAGSLLYTELNSMNEWNELSHL
jgi:hypothetical protein